MQLDVTTDLQQLEPTKYGLALHTTTPELGLAISNNTHDTRSGVWNLERELSSLMHQYLVEFIKPQTWSDLVFIAVAKGPGGFTGTRIGVVTARTLGQQLNIPVFAISTLAAVAWSQIGTNKANIGGNIAPLFQEGWGDQVIAVQMPAQRGQIFAAIYQPTRISSGLRILLPDTVFTPEAWQETLANWNTSYQLIEAKSGLAASVTSILELAHLEWQSGSRPDWSEALPYYGQHPVDK